MKVIHDKHELREQLAEWRHAGEHSINFVDEFIAREAAAQIRHKPIQAYSLRDALDAMDGLDRQRLLGGPMDDDEPPI